MGKHSFKIELANPNQPVFAGQTIEGKVVLQIDKLEKTQGIAIKCSGIGRVHFHASSRHALDPFGVPERTCASDGTITMRGQYRQAKEVFLNAYEYLLSCINDMSEQSIPPGTHKWPFRFQIPPNAPTSFKGTYGKVEYTLKAYFKSARKSDYEVEPVELPFIVQNLVDLNTWPGGVTRPVNIFYRDICCLLWKSGPGPVTITFHMKKSGFVPGQSLDFIMEVDDQSTIAVKRMRVELYQNQCYWAQGECKCVSAKVIHLNGPYVLRGIKEIWRGKTVLPDLPASTPSGLGTCHIIEKTYTLKAILDIRGACNLSKSMDIVIGTIPLREQSRPIPSALPMPSVQLQRVCPIAPRVSVTPPTAAPRATILLPNDSKAPPSYEEATKVDANLNQPKYPAVSSTKNNMTEASGPTFDPKFVPKSSTNRRRQCTML